MSKMHGPPRRLLLATDLSARCDRALDRAVQLAREWQAELVATTVVEMPRRPDPLAVPTWPPLDDFDSRRRRSQRQLEREAAGLDMPVRIRIGRGKPARAIAQAAAGEDAGLIVAGMARNEPFGRFFLGSTVEQLARTVPQPVLVVRNRVHGKYRRILVATDFSEASRHALHMAVRCFADRDLILYHAHAIPYAASVAPAARRQISRRIEGREAAAFLSGSEIPAKARARLRVVVESEGMEIALGRYVRDHEVDLAILGTQGRTGLMNVLLGSAAARMLAWLPSDTLIVRRPREGG